MGVAYREIKQPATVLPRWPNMKPIILREKWNDQDQDNLSMIREAVMTEVLARQSAY